MRWPAVCSAPLRSDVAEKTHRLAICPISRILYCKARALSDHLHGPCVSCESARVPSVFFFSFFELPFPDQPRAYFSILTTARPAVHSPQKNDPQLSQRDSQRCQCGRQHLHPFFFFVVIQFGLAALRYRNLDFNRDSSLALLHCQFQLSVADMVILNILFVQTIDTDIARNLALQEKASELSRSVFLLYSTPGIFCHTSWKLHRSQLLLASLQCSVDRSFSRPFDHPRILS